MNIWAPPEEAFSNLSFVRICEWLRTHGWVCIEKADPSCSVFQYITEHGQPIQIRIPLKETSLEDYQIKFLLQVAVERAAEMEGVRGEGVYAILREWGYAG